MEKNYVRFDKENYWVEKGTGMVQEPNNLDRTECAPQWAVDLFREIKIMQLSIIAVDRKVDRIKRLMEPPIGDGNTIIMGSQEGA